VNRLAISFCSDHPNISAVIADAAAPDDAVPTLAHAVEAHGGLDVLLNNAGRWSLEVMLWFLPQA